MSAKQIPHHTIKQDFNSLTDDEKDAYAVLAERDLVRSRTLWNELVEFLLKTKGKIPYSRMAAHLGGIVCENTIVHFLKQQEGFHTRKDRILPSLDAGAMFKRVVWAETFWWFWKCVACCPVNDVQFVLVQDDPLLIQYCNPPHPGPSPSSFRTVPLLIQDHIHPYPGPYQSPSRTMPFPIQDHYPLHPGPYPSLSRTVPAVLV